ncbi:MAG TPA: enoyl-CoA hydratase/isomerase family protein [Methylomirabilota bacterium]|jgi:enoyl-CoA hydratase/carnithine racemase
MGANAQTRWWTDAGVGYVVIDNPPMNVLSDENRRGIREALDEFRRDGVGAVVLTGAGDRAFCAGADLGEEKHLTDASVGAFLARGEQTFRLIRDYERPVIGAINGWAMGGGLVLALWCDVRVGSTRAKLGAVGVKVGLMASNVQLSRLFPEGRARDMLLTGRTVEAEEAYRLGLLSSVVTPEKLRDEATAWARGMAARPVDAVAAAKRAVNLALEPEALR